MFLINERIIIWWFFFTAALVLSSAVPAVYIEGILRGIFFSEEKESLWFTWAAGVTIAWLGEVYLFVPDEYMPEDSSPITLFIWTALVLGNIATYIVPNACVSGVVVASLLLCYHIAVVRDQKQPRIRKRDRH